MPSIHKEWLSSCKASTRKHNKTSISMSVNNRKKGPAATTVLFAIRNSEKPIWLTRILPKQESQTINSKAGNNHSSDKRNKRMNLSARFSRPGSEEKDETDNRGT